MCWFPERAVGIGIGAEVLGKGGWEEDEEEVRR